jgi:hypothetical protein
MSFQAMRAILLASATAASFGGQLWRLAFQEVDQPRKGIAPTHAELQNDGGCPNHQNAA